MAAGGGSKAIIAAFLANLGIAISKSVGFVFTGSSSMLAGTIHSVAEVERRVRAVVLIALPMYIEPGFHHNLPGDTAPETAT